MLVTHSMLHVLWQFTVAPGYVHRGVTLADQMKHKHPETLVSYLKNYHTNNRDYAIIGTQPMTRRGAKDPVLTLHTSWVCHLYGKFWTIAVFVLWYRYSPFFSCYNYNRLVKAQFWSENQWANETWFAQNDSQTDEQSRQRWIWTLLYLDAERGEGKNGKQRRCEFIGRI